MADSDMTFAPVQFRNFSFGGTGRNKGSKIRIPLDMIAALGWKSGLPVKIRMAEDRLSITITQVDPDEAGLIKAGNATWKHDL